MELDLKIMKPDTENLVRAAKIAADKMKREYHRTLEHEPASDDECWSEQEDLVDALDDFKTIYPHLFR